MTAIGEALRFLIHFATAQAVQLAAYENIVICYDSEYAAKSVLGIFNGNKNVPLISKIRDLLQAARASLKHLHASIAKSLIKRDGAHLLQFYHVKGHSGIRWNERADVLANEGAALNSARIQWINPTTTEHSSFDDRSACTGISAVPSSKRHHPDSSSTLDAASVSEYASMMPVGNISRGEIEDVSPVDFSSKRLKKLDTEVAMSSRDVMPSTDAAKAMDINRPVDVGQDCKTLVFTISSRNIGQHVLNQNDLT